MESNSQESVQQTSGLSFGAAIEAVKNGELIAREGWNGKGMFVFMRPADLLDCDMIMHKVKSLPQSFKQHITAKFAHTASEEEKGKGPKDTHIEFSAYLCLYSDPHKKVNNAWVASTGDLMAEDWYIVK